MEGCTTLKGENLVRARPRISTADASFSINGQRDELGDVVRVHVREDDNEAGSTDTRRTMSRAINTRQDVESVRSGETKDIDGVLINFF